MEIKKYIKKPVIIEAIQLNNENRSKIMEWLSSYNTESFVLKSLDNPELYIKTLEGNMKADIGDYIIKGIKNEFYPCKPEIFEMTYDKHN